LRLKVALAISGHLNVNRANPLERELTVRGTIAMIRGIIGSLVRLSSQKLREFHLHHLGEVMPDALPYIGPNEVKELLRLRLDFFENLYHFRYAHFELHGRFSFARGTLNIPVYKGKAPMLRPPLHFTHNTLHYHHRGDD
jgi:hypothetical protein